MNTALSFCRMTVSQQEHTLYSMKRGRKMIRYIQYEFGYYDTQTQNESVYADDAVLKHGNNDHKIGTWLCLQMPDADKLT